MKKNPLAVIFLTVFLDLVGFGIIIPLSPYLARHFGASALEVGLLMATYSAMQFIFSPIWGRFSDRKGRRPILLLTIAGTCLSHFMFFAAETLPMLFLSRTLAGFFGANLATAMAYIADVTTKENRSKGMGLFGAAFGLGFIVGPAIGGIAGHWGESFPALIASILSAVNFLWAYFALGESLPPEKRTEPSREGRLARMKKMFARPVLGGMFFSHLLASIAMANMEASLFLLVDDRLGWDIRTASYGFAYVGICIAFTQGFLIRKIMPIFGERKLLFLGLAGFSVGLLAVAPSFSMWPMAAAMTVFALGHGLYQPSFSGSLSVLASEQEQGEVLGTSHSVAALGRIFGPPLGGFIYDYFQAGPFVLAAVLGGLALLVLYPLRRLLPERGLRRS